MEFEVVDGKQYVSQAADLLGAVFLPSEVLDALDISRQWRVAVDPDEGVHGFIAWQRCGEYRYWNLSWLAVCAESYGQGIGRALVDRLKAEVVLKGGAAIRVETPCSSEARSFYEKCGFKLHSIMPDFYDVDRGMATYLWYYD